MLLERLRPGAPLTAHPDRSAAIDIVCSILTRLRRQPPPNHRFLVVRDRARAWSAQMYDNLHRMPSEEERRLTAEAAELAARYSQDQDEITWLVNRDVHLENVLSAEREPWLLIDPKPLVGEAALDAGYLLCDLVYEDLTVANAEVLIERLSSGLAVPADRVRGWALIRAIGNHLDSVLEHNPPPTEHLDLARTIAAT